MTLDAGQWRELGEFVVKETGLQFGVTRWPDLRRGLGAAGRELGFSTLETAADYFLSRQADQAAIGVLAKHLTVGETYFFRDPHLFAALESHILPPLIQQRRKTTRRLRIWSAGCCSGEEPYTIAILLSRLIPDIQDWEVTILGTDINSQFLRKAEAGTYSKWSFRGTTERELKTYFASKSDGSFSIRPKYKDLATFSFLNLVTDPFPSLVNNTNALDLVFCRNVLMYFSPGQFAKVVEGLRNSLVEGGWLVTSPAEAGPAFASLAPVIFPGVVVYRKVTPQKEPVKAEREVEANLRPPARPAGQPIETLSPEVSLPPAQAARAFADRGEFTEALALCEQALGETKMDASLHYLKGAILQEENRFDEALDSLRRALYLDADFVLAYFAAGMIMRRQGNFREQGKYFESALRILRNYAPQQIIPESSGMIASQLIEAIGATLQASS